jgi:hypothetical protein
MVNCELSRDERNTHGHTQVTSHYAQSQQINSLSPAQHFIFPRLEDIAKTDKLDAET